MTQWLVNYCETQLAENTVRGYRVNIDKHIVPHVGDIELKGLEPIDIQNMYTALLHGGLSPTSVRYVHAVLRVAFNCAVRQRLLGENIIYCVYPPRKPRFNSVVLGGSDLVKLIASCEGTEIYIPVLLGATLGLRRGEILGLKWSDIDFKSHTIHVQRTATFYPDSDIVLSEPKTNTSNRTLLVSHYVMCRLEELRNSRKANSPLDLVNLRPSGVPLSSSLLNKKFLLALAQSGLPRIRFHDLRHSNATLMLRNKVPAKIVSSMLGHSNVGITLDLYSHVLTDMQEPAVQVIDQLFA